MAAPNPAPQTKSTSRRTNKARNRGQRQPDGVSTKTSTEEQTSSKPVVTDKTEKDSEVKTPTTEGSNDEDDSETTCWICAEPVKFYSLSECNHRTCHVCALRLRALYKKLDCTFCKHPQSIVIFTSSPTTRFGDYNIDAMPYKDSKLSIYFETEEMMEETLILLRFNCPEEQCVFVAKGWNELKVHVRGVHGRQMCDICIRSKKVFSHEHTLYTNAQIHVHIPSMYQRPGRGQKEKEREKEKVEGGIHPLCEFCRECFFGDDELFSHMRERHEECFICKRQGIRDQYFLNYDSLERHFTDAHFPCRNTACQAQKFVVFDSLMDLKAHMVEEHGASMSSKDIKDARRVEANFEFDTSRGGGRRRERDRVGTQESPPSPPLRTLDRRREAFGSALTGENASGPGMSSSNTLQRNGRASPSPARDTDPETLRRHNAFLTRVANLSGNSPSAITSVKLAVRSFRASESGARDLISTFYNIVDRDIEATASLINLLVDLLDDENKKRELLQAFNGFKVEQRQQFPDLTPEGQDSGYAGVASGRVLNVKHSTQSRRSPGQVWDRVARAATSSSGSPVPGVAGPSVLLSDRFPALPRVSSSSTPSSALQGPAFRQSQRTTPWSTSVGPSSSAGGSRPVNSDKPPTTPKNLSKELFPSLPSSTPRLAKPPMSGNQSLRNIIGNPAPNSNAWGSGAEEGASNGNAGSNRNLDETQTQQKKGKKKGKEKMTLFTLGSFPG